MGQIHSQELISSWKLTGTAKFCYELSGSDMSCMCIVSTLQYSSCVVPRTSSLDSIILVLTRLAQARPSAGRTLSPSLPSPTTAVTCEVCYIQMTCYIYCSHESNANVSGCICMYISAYENQQVNMWIKIHRDTWIPSFEISFCLANSPHTKKTCILCIYC